MEKSSQFLGNFSLLEFLHLGVKSGNFFFNFSGVLNCDP